MYTQEKQEMRRISNYAGDRKDYVQGGGGNTSVKFDGELMAIKASGYTLSGITLDTGYVTVDYQNIKRYYNMVKPAVDKDYEKESLAVNLDSIRLLDGMENKRPSVEVGFHSFLKKYVIHTHSVYANMLCCSEEGKETAKAIFDGSDIAYIFVPYIDPGFRLTLTIKDAVEAYQAKNGYAPNAIFMENHGVIVNDDDAENAVTLHEDINNQIAAHFKLDGYPQPCVKKTADGFESGTPYLKEFITRFGGEAYFRALRLYPDQLVYIGKKLDDVIKFDSESGDIAYNTSEKEAKVIEETLMGVAYVVNEIQRAGLTLRQMNETDAAFINNWESEKYRSKLVK